MKPERIQLTNSTVTVEWVPARARLTIATWQQSQAHAIGTCLHQLAKGLGVEDCRTHVGEGAELTVSIPVDFEVGLTDLQKVFFEKAAKIGDAMTEPFEAD